MESLLLAIVLGLALLFSGIKMSGLWRWGLIIGSLMVLLTTVNRTCLANPGLCSLDWFFDALDRPLPLPDARSPFPGSPAPTTPYPDSRDPGPAEPYPDTPAEPYPDFPPPETETPAPASPYPDPERTPAPQPSVPSVPPPSRSPRPDLEPCRDGNCTCVDYKCLW